MSADLPPPYRPNPVLQALYQRFFSQIQVDQRWVDQVRQLASKGTVVYVLRNLNWVDFFNNERPHESLDDLTPIAAEELHYAARNRLQPTG